MIPEVLLSDGGLFQGLSDAMHPKSSPKLVQSMRRSLLGRRDGAMQHKLPFNWVSSLRFTSYVSWRGGATDNTNPAMTQRACHQSAICDIKVAESDRNMGV